jgi:PST family polysaccharide transporter
MRGNVCGNVFWAGLEAGVSAVLSFASAFIVARLVGPAEVGIGAAAVAMHVLLWVGVNALFADALVQAASLDENAASSAFWASSGVGVAGAAIQAASGWVLAAAFADPRLIGMSLLLALPLPLVGAGGAVQGVLTRNRSYKVLAGRAVIGQGLGTLAGITAAVAGAGAWALVLQQCVTSLVGALSLILRATWKPRLVMCWASVWMLLRTGLPLAASTLVQQSRYRVFAMLIGGTAGPAALGVVHLAFRLVDTLRDLALTALWRLMLPSMSKRQDDLVSLQANVDRGAFLAGLVMFPVIGAMLVTVRPLLHLVLGPVWEPAGLAAAPLLVLMAWVFLGFAGSVATIARGGARYSMVSQIGVTSATIVGVLVLRPATPLAAASVWFAAQVLVNPYMMLQTARLMQAGVFRQYRAGLPVLGLACIATAAVLFLPFVPASPAGLIAIRLATIALVYGAGVALLLRGALLSALAGAPVPKAA